MKEPVRWQSWPAKNRLGMTVYPCGSSIWNAEVWEQPWVHGHSGLHSEYQARHGCRADICLENQTNKLKHTKAKSQNQCRSHNKVNPRAITRSDIPKWFLFFKATESCLLRKSRTVSYQLTCDFRVSSTVTKEQDISRARQPWRNLVRLWSGPYTRSFPKCWLFLPTFLLLNDGNRRLEQQLLWGWNLWTRMAGQKGRRNQV